MGDLVDLCWYKSHRSHRRHAAVLPLVYFNAWVDYWNTVTKATLDAVFAPYH